MSFVNKQVRLDGLPVSDVNRTINRDLTDNFAQSGYSVLYKLYRYVRRQRVWFLSRFGLKWGIGFDNFGLKCSKVCAP